MAKSKVKKQKLVKKAENNNKIEKKLRKKKKKKVEKVPKKETQTANDSDNDSSEPESDKIQTLLEPYTKDQLIDFIIDAAIEDVSLFNRIRDAADLDVSHRKIFVYGLGWDTTRETLLSVFQSFGEIDDCNVVTDRVTGRAKGYGFVCYKSRRGAMKALKQPRKKIGNRMASCQLASVGSVPLPQSQDTMGRKIYISNVQADVDPEKLRVFFAKFGEIETGPIGFDMNTGKSRGFAMFVYMTPEGARKALEEPYKMFEGHQLHCRMATDGKQKQGAGSVMTVTTGRQPVQPPMLAAAAAAAQNLALFNQHSNLNHMYGGLFANQNAQLLAAGSMNPLVAAGGMGQGVLGSSQVGQMGGPGGSLGNVAAGLGGYGAAASHGLGSLGGTPSVLGAYGSSNAPALQGLQHAYPKSQIEQTPSRAYGPSGSFSGYPSYG